MLTHPFGAIPHQPSINCYLKLYTQLLQSYYSSQPVCMKLSDSKLSKSSAYMHRPFTTNTNSPRKLRENNFLLDCINRQSATLPTYKPQADAFSRPYVLTLLHKVKSQTADSAPSFKIKPHFKIRQSSRGCIEAEKFKSFLAEKMQVVLQRMESLKNTGASSARNSVQKENISMHKQKNRKDKYLDHKFSSYKIRNKKGANTKKPRICDSAHEN